MDYEKISELFEEVLAGDDAAAGEQIAQLPSEERQAVLNGLKCARTEADRAGRGQAVRLVLERFAAEGS